MEELFWGLLFIVAGIICFVYPYSFNQKYMDKYNDKGISYPIAILSGASVLLLCFVYKNQETIQYSLVIILMVISAILNLCKILKDCRKVHIEVGDRIQLAICQILSAIGIFGMLVAMLVVLCLAGRGNNRKKRK